MKKSTAPMPKPPAKGMKKPPFGKRDAEDIKPDGDAAPGRADRPARKSGGSVKKGH